MTFADFKRTLRHEYYGHFDIFCICGVFLFSSLLYIRGLKHNAFTRLQPLLNCYDKYGTH